MAVQYQVDGNVFLEIKTNWLCASVNEFFIKARQLDTDQAGNTIEYFQLNDSRVFTREVPAPQALDISKVSKIQLWDSRTLLHEHSATQPR
jgi:hypothetical protein